MHITDLSGHSGCKILLCETEDDKTYVRKISKSKEYNCRLIKQANKQKEYFNEKVKVPKIIQMGKTKEGLAYFDMEYIQGRTLSEYIKTVEIGKIRGLVELLVYNIVDLNNQGKAYVNVFAEKIELLNRELDSFRNSVVNEALKILSLHSWDHFTESMCHGDLTLENIIVKDNQLYLIDFLDSFYDCWIMDIGTLMQDVQVMWAYRRDKIDINTIIRLIIFRDILVDKVKEVSANLYIEVYYALLLKLIRIYPYTQDKNTLDFLNKKTRLVIDIIRAEERI